jgi:hypothetical protein
MTAIKPRQKLLLDKITFTFPVDENLKNTLIIKINDRCFYEPYNRKVYSNKKQGRYKNNYQFTIHGENKIELSIYPINKNHNFLRVEYNPTKLGKEGRVKLREFLIKLLGLEVVKTIYFKTVITRVDLTLDVFDMEPNLYLYKRRIKESEIFFDGNGDNISSQILGSNTSNCRVTMYNKNLEQGKKTEVNNYQRIEVRLRNLKTSIAGMKECGDVLLRHIKELEFFHADFLTDSYFSEDFKRKVRKEGVNSGINSLSDNQKRCCRRHLEEYRVYPIMIEELNFEKAHNSVLNSLLHPDFRNIT